MSFRHCRFGAAAALLFVLGTGCQSLHHSECTDTCGNDADHCERWSDEWYCQHAGTATGARQKCHKGKSWPPFPRPTGPKQEFWHRFHTAHYWPYPYNTQDLRYLRTVSARQVANGWTTETTLFGFHFAAETHELNQAGRLKLKWIVQIVPAERRQVWIQASDDAKVNAARMASAKKVAAEYAVDGNVPPMSLRVAPTDGRPTDEVNRIRLLENGSMNVPRIPFSIGGRGSGSGAGSAGIGGNVGQ